MDYPIIKPSPVNTGADLLAKVRMIHGGMRQYMDGDRDMNLLISINERFLEIGQHGKAIKDCTSQQWNEITQKLEYIRSSMVTSRHELVVSGLIQPF